MSTNDQLPSGAKQSNDELITSRARVATLEAELVAEKQRAAALEDARAADERQKAALRAQNDELATDLRDERGSHATTKLELRIRKQQRDELAAVNQKLAKKVHSAVAERNGAFFVTGTAVALPFIAKKFGKR